MRLISQGAQYAISAIIAISKHTEDGAVSASFLSKSLNCPTAYLSQVLAKLKEPGILKSQRGLNGGVYLAKPVNQVTMMDVIAAIDGTEFFDKCFMGIEGCGNIEPCPFHEFWSVERKKIEKWLRETTFEQVDQKMTQKWFDLRLQFSNGGPSFK
ncbi:RrF2 family transcriptional regulator [Gracilimonas tropica]|uniref:RrF2 family transcriptional regulator n=1 Tax=Gracilimonas tropica TaxID=454600 RepID=UPI000367C0DA|nr:Rrf2 family transcriptional regulator [Gracilimonas tropica]